MKITKRALQQLAKQAGLKTFTAKCRKHGETAHRTSNSFCCKCHTQHNALYRKAHQLSLVHVDDNAHTKVTTLAGSQGKSISDVMYDLAIDALNVPTVKNCKRALALDEGTHSLICEYAKRNGVTLQSAANAIINRGIQ